MLKIGIIASHNEIQWIIIITNYHEDVNCTTIIITIQLLIIVTVIASFNRSTQNASRKI